jgi:hypothetical protein
MHHTKRAAAATLASQSGVLLGAIARRKATNTLGTKVQFHEQ